METLDNLFSTLPSLAFVSVPVALCNKDLNYLNEMIDLYGEFAYCYLPSETCVSYINGELQFI